MMDSENPKMYHKLDLTLSWLVVIQVVMRAAIISIRYGSLSPIDYRDLWSRPINYEKVTEKLIVVSWSQVNPEFLTKEIDLTCSRYTHGEDFFRVKLLTPLYPIDKQKYIDKEFHAKRAKAKKWTFGDAKREEAQL
jgi:hypothetical protein